MKRLLILISLVFICTSCTKTLEIPIPQHSQKPVVSCFFTQDSTFKMQLSNSVGVLDDFDNQITEAEILLFENQTLIDTLTYNGNEYESQVLGQTGKEYTFKTNIEGFEKISSTNFIPNVPIIGDCIISDANIWLDEEYLLNQEVQISIQDDIEKKNYYEIFLMGKTFDEENNEESIRGLSIYSDSPVIETEGLNDFYPDAYVFSDHLFDNNSVTLSINYRQPSTNWGNGNFDFYDYSLIIVMRSITKEYYEHTKKLYQHLWNQENDIWDGFGEPVQMYSNIENGYGIFAGYNEVRKEVFPDK